jgi:hypothetical protein
MIKMNGSTLMEIKNSNFSTFNYGLSKNTSANVLVVLELITSICLLIGNGYIFALIQRVLKYFMSIIKKISNGL